MKSRSWSFTYRMALTLVILFSLLSLPGALSHTLQVPGVFSAQAIPAPCPTHGSTGVCSENWYPAGPAMNTLFEAVFLNCPTCLTIMSPPPPDLTDSPVPPSQIGLFNASSNVYLTAAIGGARFAYLSNWQRVINDESVGVPNYFTWLDAYSSTPTVAGTVRQAVSQTTRSVNPYIASTVWDTYVVGNVYDSLYASNPLDHTQLIDWMTVSTQMLSNSSLTYPAPAHTLTTYRFTLRSDMFFQDGRSVTAYDVAFSYLSMVASGAFFGQGATSMTGITILSPHQFDIGVSTSGPFVLFNLTSIPIVPGRYWTNAGSSAWDSATATCTTGTSCGSVQYVLSSSSVTCTLSCDPGPGLMTISPTDVAANFDPIANHSFIGSGPWQCGMVTSSGSGSCTPSGTQNPPLGDGYTLTRFGNGLAPASSISGIYFRSSGNLALYLWSEQNDVSPLLAFVAVASCYQIAVNLAGPCGHFQQGIGNPGTGTPVGVSQVSVSSRFYNLNWIEPFNWIVNPPIGIAPFPPILYEGSVVLPPGPCPGSGYLC